MPPKTPPPSPEEQQAANDRLATKRMRLDINAVLVRWDPLCLKGLRGGDRAYEGQVGPLLLLVKRGAGEMEIARFLVDVMRDEWRLPPDNARCVEVARRLRNIGAVWRGEDPTAADASSPAKPTKTIPARDRRS